MLVKQVHHVSFAVRDLARSREFYEGLLGLRSIERPNIGLPGVWYAAGEGQIHLIQTPPGASVGAAPDRLTPLANHCAFEIDDYDQFVETIRRRGLALVETNREMGQLFVQDPDGNVIELIRTARTAR
jgi:catechol 2,3-dioxygenase-like lactoylglutathione lyase family enzyme